MTAKQDPKPPAIPAVELSGLADTSAMDLRDGESHELERYVDEDFGGLDLRSTSFTECEFTRPVFDGADLRGTHVSESLVRGMNTVALAAARSGWRRSRIEQSRLGSAELHGSSWQQVLITESKLGFLNLRGATILDLRFVGCTIDELDLGSARLNRVDFIDCRIAVLDLAGARLLDVDLRGAGLNQVKSPDGLAGATVSELQLQQLAPQFAAHLGVRVR